MFGIGISIIWNVVGIILPFASPGFFQPFSNVPYVFYSESFYSGEAYDSTPFDERHPFLEKFNKHSGIFHHEIFIIFVLIFMLIIQIIFCACLVKLYRRLKLAKYLDADDDERENLKELWDKVTRTIVKNMIKNGKYRFLIFPTYYCWWSDEISSNLLLQIIRYNWMLDKIEK